MDGIPIHPGGAPAASREDGGMKGSSRAKIKIAAALGNNRMKPAKRT
jgi:hypothetical protein